MGELLEEKEITPQTKADEYVSEDPVILDAFSDMKNAIMAKRTDIVRQILSAAQSLREEDEFDSDGEEYDKKILRDKYDHEEYLDLLSLLLLHKDTDSGTLLHYATRVDSADIVRALLAAGANCTVKNTENLNAYAYCQTDSMRNAYVGELMQAVTQSRIFRIQQLLAAGIDVNSCDGGSYNNSILHWAVSFADSPTVQLIIKSGGAVNANNAHGEVPLHDAVKRGDIEIVKELLQNGADPHVQPFKGSLEGKSPLTLAQGKPEIEAIVKVSQQTGRLSVHSEDNEIDSAGQNGEALANGEIPSLSTLTNKLSVMPTTSDNISTNACSHLPKKVDVDSSFSFLCPQPQRIKQFEGLFFVPPTELTIQVIASQDDILALKATLDLFVLKFKAIGIRVLYEYHNSACCKPPKGSFMQCIVSKNTFTHKQEYKMQFNTHKVLILSSDLPSMFYGLSTFLHILKIFKGKAIPLAQICDWPIAMNRSIIFDFQNNDAPRVEVFSELVDLLALFKVNQIQLNIDHVIETAGKVFYSPNEVFEFQLFCRQRFIEVSPYIVINKDSPLLISFEQLDEKEFIKHINNFVFSKYLHVSIGDNIDSHKILHQLRNICTDRGIVLQFTSQTIVDVHAEQAMSLMNNFLYSFNAANISDFEQKVKFPDSFGLQYSVCINNEAMHRISPNHVEYLTAVQSISSQLPRDNCYGFSMKYNTESRQISNISMTLPSLLISASMGWNTPKSMEENYIKSVTNYLIYEDDHDLIATRIIELGRMFPAHRSTDDSSVTTLDSVMKSCSMDTKCFTSANIQEYCRQLKMLKQELEKMKLNFTLKQFVYDEFAMNSEILFVISKLCYSIVNQTTEKSLVSLKKFSNLPEITKSDNANKLMVVIKQYESFMTKYYIKSIPSCFTSVQILKDILKEILPSSTPPTSPNLMGVFDI